ncbi:BamA/TamA family outer membrane protein [Flavobacterium sp. SM2513]|uniref:translocation and assembly module lipoprotein TamL n=1 Tax=Flavobacterium sp. SM2513 TaxID=3424766 RepID=UPI003D7FD1E9
MNSKQLLYSVLFLFLLSSCNTYKYVPEGDLLYTGGSVKVQDSLVSKKQRKALQSEMEDMLRPLPNKTFLGLRPKLFFYNLVSETKKDKGFKHWVKYKLGEPPVLYSKVDLDYNEDILRNYSENNGYFKTKVESDSTRRGRKASAEYSVEPRKQYRIKSVTFPDDSTAIAKQINRISRRSLLKPNRPYNLEIIKLERQRIDTRLKEKGFFYFSEDDLLIQVDSTVGKSEVDLIVKIKEQTLDKSLEQYRINNIIVYPNYSINDTIFNTEKNAIKHNDLTIIDEENIFDPRVFDRTLYFKKDDLYNRTDHNLSLNRLVNLGTFKFVKNTFKIADTTGNYLDAYYYLTPLPKKSIRLEVLGKTNSANYSGTELNVNWSNRNTFKGAELLSVSVFGGLEVQVSGQNNGFNVYRLGGETSLIWPRFIAPIKLNSASGFVPRTKASLGYEFQQRDKLYSLNTFKGSFGYIWKENIRKEHELKVSEITYVSPMHVTSLYQSQIDENEALGKVIEKQLIFGPTYSYTYTNTMQKRKKNTMYFKGDLELAGTIAGLVTGADANKEAPKEILDVPFSQFVKLQAEFRFYHKLGKNSEIASRVIAGGAFAYGNSTTIPFIKQFFIGGTNSIRAFRARSIGPGSFIPEATGGFLPDQSGDVKLEFSTEYRAKIYSVVNGAVFLDAGNIWSLEDGVDNGTGNRKFSKKFFDEIAVGAGVGLRFDLSILVLRTDFAVPLRLPYGALSDRWVLDNINLKSGVFNLAIGYPF